MSLKISKSKKLIAGKHSCVGHLNAGSEDQIAEGDGFMDRNVMCVYTGKFDSMDGEVEITEDHLTALAANHNKRVDGSARLASGEPNMADFPPLQLDHSTSAAMTVGRVPFKLSVGDFIDKDGKKKKALFGRVRVLGKENVEKSKDGRYTHVSIGADLDTGILNELSITPFPAAPNASLLKNGATKLSTGGSMDKEKLKKHLMEHEKLSEKEADEKLAAMSDEDGKKLSKEVDDKEKLAAADADAKEKEKLAAKEADEKEEGKEKLAASKKEFVKLAKGFKTASGTARLNQNKSKIAIRLSALRAKSKVTPAEIKEIDIAKLASKGDEAIEAVLDSYEKREPQVLVGMFGTQKGESTAKLAKSAMLSALETEARVQFTSNPKNKKFAEGQKEAPKSSEENMADGAEEKPSGEHLAVYDSMKKCMEEGKHEEALAHAEHLGSLLKRLGADAVGDGKDSKDAESHMSALAGDVKTMQELFGDLVKLASANLGVDTSEIE